MKHPFAITLDSGSSLANLTGSWRTERPVYVDRLPPCNNACPAGENIQQWLYHAESGDYEKAWRQLTQDNPMPAVMGRVCYHPCETACNRAQVDEAVGINSVERFLGDEAIKRGWRFDAPAQKSGKRVLVVGAGPSGLSAAYHLARLGHAVAIHEAGPVAGGMMRFGIPKYRLPRDVLEAEIRRILDLGVEHTHGVPRRNIDMLADAGADRDEDRVEIAGCLFPEHVANRVVGDDLDPHRLDARDFAHEIRARETIGGNAEMHHAAGERPRFADFDMMTETRKMIGG